MKGKPEGDLEGGRRASELAARMAMTELQSKRRRLVDLQKNWEIAGKLLESFLQAAAALKGEDVWGPDADIAAPMEAIQRFLARCNSAASILNAFAAAPDHEFENDLVWQGLMSGPLAESILKLMRETLEVRRTGPGPSSLSALGMGFPGTGPRLNVVKEDALTEALQSDLEGVRRLFADGQEGIAVRMEAVLEAELEDKSGLIARECEALRREIGRIERSIDVASELLEAARHSSGRQ